MQVVQSFPIRSKFDWKVGPVNLKFLPDQKEISPDSRWSMADSHLVRPKKQPKNKTDQKITGLEVRCGWVFCWTYLCFTRHVRSVRRYWERLVVHNMMSLWSVFFILHHNNINTRANIGKLYSFCISVLFL